MNPHRGFPEDITEAYYRGLMHSGDTGGRIWTSRRSWW